MRRNSSTVLEVGLADYELSSGYLLIQVMMKLVDPASGSVIAKARNASHPKVDDVDSLFAGNAAGYKQFIHETTTMLVQECTEKLGLHEI